MRLWLKLRKDDLPDIGVRGEGEGQAGKQDGGTGPLGLAALFM